MAAPHTALNSSSSTACNAQALFLPNNFTGIDITQIQAVSVTDYSMEAGIEIVWTKTEYSGLDLCNVTVEYNHPGRDDAVTVTVLLPEAHAWNGRFAGIGGGGWAATSGDRTMVPAVDAGFAAASTDGGAPTNSKSSASWALLSPGNPDIERLDLWANQALHEMTIIGKAVTEAYYRNPAAYSYWFGCSQGGRQGNTMAQRYPTDYDGIAALAPAVNWANFFPELQWPRQLMYELDSYPPPCEVSAFTAAAVAHCDVADGLIDGLISRPDLCSFDPFDIVGKSFPCNGSERTFTSAGARIVHGAWTGVQTSLGALQWYGYGQDSPIVNEVSNTECATPSNCTISPDPLGGDWLQYWSAANSSLDLTTLTRDTFTDLIRTGILEYESVISANFPDLRPFRDAGGKMITWHGLADELIPTRGSLHYHDAVRNIDANVDDYFRLFLAPGTVHCRAGNGPFPTNVVQDLMAWVEEGRAPEQLVAQRVSDLGPTTGELRADMNQSTSRGRPLCPVPKMQEYVGGDPDMLDSFRCVVPGKSWLSLQAPVRSS